MTWRAGGGSRVSRLLRRLAGGLPPREDEAFNAALDSALTRAREHDQRLAALQARLDVLGRMRR